ncbi:MAG: alpha-glucan family phosphorylase [Pseudomonadota bacterium]
MPTEHQDDAVEMLTALALNLRSSWNHSADELWAQIDLELWKLTSNPWAVVQSASPARLRAIVAAPEFRRRLLAARDRLGTALSAATWFQNSHPGSPLRRVAYFSMEFALAESLPIYSGGLGNVAGDQLKAASDLGVPVVGVGLLYQQGYFRQVIAADGSQEALYPYNDPHLLPITPVKTDSGDVLRLAVHLPGQTVWLRAWEARVGRSALYLLDANDPANPPAVRGITSELYGGALELRLRQEILLGIGGFHLLSALGLESEVCHLNEGHAAFAVLERARRFMASTGKSFDACLEVTRGGNLFTTHTPVPAGFDRFPEPLMRRFLRIYAEESLGIDFHALMALGRQNPADVDEPFNMAYLAIRGSGAVNGVSRLHGQVSRHIFQALFPGWPEAEVPVAHVTNGVHTPSWDSPEADLLWTKISGPGVWQGSLQSIEKQLETASDQELWAMRAANRTRLVEYARERSAQQQAANGTAGAASSSQSLNPNVLTLGFARRFATYKRANLLLTDPERLLRILTNTERPVQLVVAGKAHPADKQGQQLIASWNHFIRDTAARGRVVFLEDYDLLLAEYLVRGVDVWLNTPRRPWEASGTSGMKVLVNGGLNLSELDGWWAEAYEPAVGWAIGDGREHGDDPNIDAADANTLYELLEREVVPAFYGRDARGMPTAWLTKMRASMGRLTPRFSSNRAVREYTDGYYVPAAERYLARAANGGALGEEILAWRRDVEQRLPQARFGELRVARDNDAILFSVQVYFGELEPAAVQVQLFADSTAESDAERHVMTRNRQIDAGAYSYTARVQSSRPADSYTPRLVPFHASASVPLEVGAIRWQR